MEVENARLRPRAAQQPIAHVWHQSTMCQLTAGSGLYLNSVSKTVRSILTAFPEMQVNGSDRDSTVA
jgi:hypothetical protein